METKYSHLPKIPVTVYPDEAKGSFEGWRHTISHGGISRYPLPRKVIKGAKLLRPRMIRTFIQEFFQIYPEHGVFSWTLLDPYMDALAELGGEVVACITIKPKPLYPEINERIIMPNDTKEWQQVIEALVHRYSVEKKIVTYWEIANETDMGELGGCPYQTLTTEEYNEYYKITQEAVLRAFPEAKVGGPAVAIADGPYIEALVKYCIEENLQLDFVSWHLYSDVPKDHSGNVYRIREMLDRYYPQKHIETLITEMNCGFHDIFVDESVHESRCCAAAAAAVFDMMDAKADWSFFYHVWDQIVVKEQFAPFYSKTDYMMEYWNKTPQHLGMFGVCCEVRPSYFFYRFMEMMREREGAVESASGDIRGKTTYDKNGSSTILVNYNEKKSGDLVVEIDFKGITDGFKLVTVYRIDNSRHWAPEKLTMQPVERRYVDVCTEDSKRPFFTQVYCPADSVTYIAVDNVTEEQMLMEYAAE